MNIEKLTEEIINGRRLTENDDLGFLKTADIAELSAGADRLRKHFSGEKVDRCSIIAGKSGRCSENCRFCAQSAHSHTGCEEYELLDYEPIYKAAKANQDAGVDRFAVVDSGWGPDDAEFEKLIDIFGRLNSELDIKLCASLGFLSDEQFRRLRAAGVSSYHNNIETSRSNFANVCTTHTFEDKIANIRRAQAAGFRVCSGGIIGMGETIDDRIEMALELAKLGIKSIPINVLTPIPNTPFESLPPLSEEDVLRAVAIFRFIVPEADIRLAAGRKNLAGNGRRLLENGASAMITGDMLTTTGATAKSDAEMLKDMGRL